MLPAEKFKILPCGTQSELKTLVTTADFLVIGKYVKATKDVINSGQNLKLIQRAGLLYHNHVDVAAATKAGILVCVTPTMITVTVAEHTMMLMLALSKNLLQSHNACVYGEYQSLDIKPTPTSEKNIPNTNWMKLAPQLLYQKNLGIIGMGEIGLTVAKLARCFGMKIMYFDKCRLPISYESELAANFTHLQELLKKADYVTLHIPHTKETEKFIGAQELSLMKKSSFLINVSRGGVIDERALCRALERSEIAGASLDVFTMEPVPHDNPLLKCKNMCFTPHIAGISQEASKDIERLCSNILRVARGEKPENTVN